MIDDGRRQESTSADGEQSWRELTDSRSSRIYSRKAWKRRQIRWFRLLAGLALSALLLGGGIQLVRILRQGTEKVVSTASVNPIEAILFYTDGVLSKKWLEDTIDLQVGMPMMEVDLFALKETLESSPQIRSASVERIFPGDIRIDIIEHKPVLRLVIANADGQRQLRLVARDGRVYKGTGYSKSALRQLPYLQPYQHANGSYLPLQGIEPVAEFLELVYSKQPKLFSTWQVVSLEHYSGDSYLPGQVIKIRSLFVPEIVFSANKDYALQLDRLIYILDYFSKNGDPSLERIDLSLRGSAAVRLSSGRAQVF